MTWRVTRLGARTDPPVGAANAVYPEATVFVLRTSRNRIANRSRQALRTPVAGWQPVEITCFDSLARNLLQKRVDVFQAVEVRVQYRAAHDYLGDEKYRYTDTSVAHPLAGFECEFEVRRALGRLYIWVPHKAFPDVTDELCWLPEDDLTQAKIDAARPRDLGRLALRAVRRYYGVDGARGRGSQQARATREA